MTELGYKTLRESIVDIIRKRIINRELQPGQKIVEQELAKEFKTSRAPIREALRELENEGLVEYVRNAGCSVKEITFEESFEIYLMRANYEIMAASSGRKDTGRNPAGDGRNTGTHEESECG